MTGMAGSGISTTKSDTGTLITSASLSFFGDRLEPDRITALLGVQPTNAYRKGEVYLRSRGREARGRTGLWLLSSEPHMKSIELNDHLIYLRNVLFPPDGESLIEPLCSLMQEKDIEAEVSCFWYGEHGAQPPVIPEAIRAAFALIGATIELDFDTD